jgi:predicted KAP-like P-loop ATPase
MFQNDSPIRTINEDKLNRSDFSEKLGKSLLQWTDDTSLVIALYGSWGSGKSSIINLTQEFIEKSVKSEKKKPIIFSFNPWNFTEQNQLITIFFKELAKSINYYDKSEDAKRVGNELIAYSKFFEPLSVIPPVTPLALLFKKVFGSMGEAVKAWGDLKTKTLDQYKTELDKHIKKLNRKIIIIIDDIDRLNPSEIKQIFQLIKLNANFPNLIYLLPFDQKKVSDVLTDGTFSGKDYLEKIVQVPFHIPGVEQVKLNSLFFEELNKVIKPIPQKDWDEKYFANIFYGHLQKYFASVRQIKRYFNSLQFNMTRLPKELNPVDLLALEAIRVFSPEVYDGIWKNKEVFTEADGGYSSRSDGRDKEIRKAKIEAVFETSDNLYKSTTQQLVIELFPQLKSIYGNSHHGGEWHDTWNKQKKIASQYRFDKYFLFSVPEDEVTQDEIDKIITNSGNVKLSEKNFKSLIRSKKIKSFLEKLSLYVDDVPVENVESFTLALFNVSDEIPREKSGMAFLDTESWCVRFGYHMLLKIKDLDKREEMFLMLIDKSKSLQVPLTLASIEVRERKGSSTDSEPLVQEKNLQVFRDAILKRITESSKTDNLLNTPNLLYLLFLWRDVSSIDKPKAFVTELIKTEKGFLKLIESLMFQSSSQVMGEYVSTTTWKINPDNLKEFTDLTVVKSEAQRLANDPKKKYTERQKLGLKLFIENTQSINLDDFIK